MPEVRYVCLSDLHLGEEDSLLTNLATASTEVDPSQPSPVLEKLIGLLRDLVDVIGPKDRRPTLILNGDVLELALSPIHQAAMVFEKFVSLVLPKGKRLFDRIIVIPGNHDHHLWEIARETQYVNYIRSSKFPPGEKLPEKWSVTNLFVEDEPLSSYFLENVIRRYAHLKEEVIQIAYPNFGLVNQSKERVVVFHHGHFVESLYHLMSKLKTLLIEGSHRPTRIWDIEAENFSWIDFFWSTMGGAGEVGEDMERIYEKLQDPDEITKVIANLILGLGDPEGAPDWDDRIKRKILEWGLSPIVRAVFLCERLSRGAVLSPDAQKGLRWYLAVPLKNQIANEIERRPDVGLRSFPEVTFVFGHTHKPFADDLDIDHYQTWVHTYNTGGWVVDTLEPEPFHGGGLVLIDESLNTVGLKLYHEEDDETPMDVQVQTALRAAGGTTNFVRRVNAFVRGHGQQLTEFGEAVVECTRIRREHLRNRVHG
jgi:hypothetical protein